MGLPYATHPVDIASDQRFDPDFLKISPNNKIPAIVDGDVTLFESGAILLYLADKTGKLAPPAGTGDYWRMMQWLMWQVGGFGPMLGQAHHFLHFHPGVSDYAEKRFHDEARRLYRVLDTHLTGNRFLAGTAMTIADIAVWPWASRFDYQRIDLDEFPSVKRWYLALAARPAFQRGYAQPIDTGPVPMPAAAIDPLIDRP